VEGILIFEGTHQVMKAEKILKGAGIVMRLIPVPRSLTSDCGLAIRVDDSERMRVIQTLKFGRNYPKEYYVRAGKVYTKVEAL